VDEGADAALAQGGHESVAPGVAHHEEVVDRSCVVRLSQEPHSCFRELAAVEAGELAATLGPPGEVLQADPQDRRLQLVEPAVDPGLVVAVPVALAPVAEPPQPGCELRLAHQEGPPVAEGTEVLGRVERQRSARTQGPRRATFVARAMGLARVLDDRDRTGPGTGQDRFHVRGLAVEMHGKDRPRPGRDRLGDRVRVEVQRLRVHVHEDRSRARGEDGQAGEGSGKRRGDDLVARAHADRDQGELQGLGPVCDRDRLAGLEGRGELALERLDLRAEDEPPGVDDAPDRRVELSPQGGDPGLQVDEGDLGHQR
jgi:hypothetical protein